MRNQYRENYILIGDDALGGNSAAIAIRHGAAP